MIRRHKKNGLLLGLLGLYFISMITGCSQQPATGQSTPSLIPVPSGISQTIVHENSLPGTSDWQIPANKAAYHEIQAYTDSPSVLPGHTLVFYVSTQGDRTPYSISIYRVGWYQGKGGRLITTISHLTGLAQGYFDIASNRLINCYSCTLNSSTGLVEANWQPSYQLKVPADWVSGVYLAKFINVNGIQTYAPFVVKGNTSSAYVAVTADTAATAYNDWGGYSLYEYNSLKTNPQGRASMVSFNRPYVDIHGSGYVLNFEADAIHWMERQGYDVSYISDIDLHEDPAQLLHHRVYISIGHDEYWTKEMRDGVENARDHGVSLAFLEANAIYWQIRLEPDAAGHKDRIVVCYKVETALHDLARDPLYGKDNSRVTSQWRDPVVGRPENAVIGIMYSDLNQQHRGFPWVVSPQANSPLLQGTGLQPGKAYGCELVGYEWDRIFNNGATPKNLQVIGLTPTINDAYGSDVSHTTYYFAPSGAMVFATGSVYWAAALDNYRVSPNNLCPNQEDTQIPEMQKLMANVMKALLSHRI